MTITFDYLFACVQLVQYAAMLDSAEIMDMMLCLKELSSKLFTAAPDAMIRVGLIIHSSACESNRIKPDRFLTCIVFCVCTFDEYDAQLITEEMRYLDTSIVLALVQARTDFNPRDPNNWAASLRYLSHFFPTDC